MNRNRLTAAVSACIICMQALPKIPASAAETYLIRDKWGYCQSAHYAESEHFVIFYGDKDTTGEVNEAFLKRNLADYETLWKCYTEYLGMENLNVDIYGKSQQKYKTNVYLTYTGLPAYEEGWAFMSSEDGYGIEIISPKAMLDELTIAHEFGHVVTLQQKAWVDQDITGAWWEPLANWFREMYLMSDYYKGDTKTCWFEPYLRNMSLTIPHGRNYYETFPFLVYLSYNPDHLGTLGIDFVKRMISEAKPAEYPLDTVTRLSGVDAQTILGHYAKRMATFDFAAKDAYRAEFQKKLAESPFYWNLFYTVPEQTADGTFRVPQEEAPMQSGINVIPLQISGDTVSVTFQGLSDDPNADWKACIVTADAKGNTQYSDLFSSGETMHMPANGAKQAYLTVIAVPKTFVKVNAFHKEKDSAYCTGSERRRYPYAFTLSGAAVQQSGGYSKGRGHAHPNGGGWVADSASVADSVYVAPDAMVLGNAKLTGNVRVEDRAVVANAVTASDNAVISGHAVVSGGGWVYVDGGWKQGSVTVSGNAVISDSAVVTADCSVGGNAKILQKAYLAEAVSVSGNAVVKGMAYLYGKGNYSGTAVLDGDYCNEETLTSGVHFGWLDDSYKPKEAGMLLAGYDFDKSCSAWAAERYSSTQAALSGIEWQAERTSAKGVAALDGAAQIELEDALFRTSGMQISLGALWKGGASGQQLLHIGDDKVYLSLTPSDESGRLSLTLTDGKTTEILRADTAPEKGTWHKISVQLFDGKCTLLLDGKKAAESAVTLTPQKILSAASADRAIVGSDGSGNGFRGAIDYVYLYSEPAAEPSVVYSGSEDAEPDQLRGDVDLNGKVERADAMLLQKFLLTQEQFSDAQYAAADLDGSRQISAADLSVLKQILRAG
ncbi:MAG: N-acetylglucosamine-1-phosphate uridyltransferase [Oscillospiraceae bacterium]|nr:N-acetylglucosamine-1-phosphate uridyltransferase [Oscillospiraceae bacterium]